MVLVASNKLAVVQLLDVLVGACLLLGQGPPKEVCSSRQGRFCSMASQAYALGTTFITAPLFLSFRMFHCGRPFLKKRFR